MSKIDIGVAPDIFFENATGHAEISYMGSQMNVSITDQLATYVRKKVKSGRYNNASEVVREALRRMEEEDARAVRMAKPIAEDLLADLTAEELEDIRGRVRAGMESMRRGEYRVYEGREGLKQLADNIKARGRRRLAQEISKK